MVLIVIIQGQLTTSFGSARSPGRALHRGKTTYNNGVFGADKGRSFLCSQRSVCDNTSYIVKDQLAHPIVLVFSFAINLRFRGWFRSQIAHRGPRDCLDLPAGRVEEKVLSWVRASREIYRIPNISKLHKKYRRGRSKESLLQHKLWPPRRSVLRAENCRGSNFFPVVQFTYRRARGQLPQCHRGRHRERSKRSGVTRLRPRKKLKQQWPSTVAARLEIR
ncbi:hypothetical protein HDV63DRAFT_193359 [Trichoderma sp. SZMC 28014]